MMSVKIAGVHVIQIRGYKGADSRISKPRDGKHNESTKGKIVVLLGMFAEQADCSSGQKEEALNWQFG